MFDDMKENTLELSSFAATVASSVLLRDDDRKPNALPPPEAPLTSCSEGRRPFSNISRVSYISACTPIMRAKKIFEMED
jgi:hypothetical protein